MYIQYIDLQSPDPLRSISHAFISYMVDAYIQNGAWYILVFVVKTLTAMLLDSANEAWQSMGVYPVRFLWRPECMHDYYVGVGEAKHPAG